MKIEIKIPKPRNKHLHESLRAKRYKVQSNSRRKSRAQEKQESYKENF